MKTSFATILGIALLPLSIFASTGSGPIVITSLSEGFVISEEADTIPVGGTIVKGFWENPISKLGGRVVVSASAGSKQISQAVEYVFPSLHPTGKYGFGIALDADAIRGATELPLTVRVEAKNSNGALMAYAEVHGTLQPKAPPALTITLASFTPPSTSYERGSAMNSFTAITFAAGIENTAIQQLTLTRSGGRDNDLLNIRIFDGSTQVGTADRFDGGKITFFLDALFVMPKGLTKTLMVKADIDPDAGIYSIENGIAIGIANSSDVRALGMETGAIIEPADFVPVFGNRMGIQ